MERDADRVVIGNSGILFVAQGISFAAGLLMVWIVPRSVGAAAWGEWTLAWAMTGIMSTVCAFGLDTLLVREIARRPEQADRLLGAALSARLVLLVPFLGGLALLTRLGPYSAHTRLIIAVVVAASVVSFVAMPVASSLQAMQRMHYISLGNVITAGVVSVAAVVLVKVLAAGMLAIGIAALSGAVLAAAVQFGAQRRHLRLRLAGDWRLVRGLLADGLPFWASSVFLTVYVWADMLMLSWMTSTTEVGWYGASTKLLSVLGTVPYVINMAVFPAVSRDFRDDPARVQRLARASIRLVLTMALPMTAGLVLVAPAFVRTLYGWSFAPAGITLSVLALTLPPIFFATVVNGLVIAADRQVAWTWVMAACCVVNPLLNVAAIWYFEKTQHNGALGAALTLAITDGFVGVAALALLPAGLRDGLREIRGPLVRTLAATALMALVVWSLRQFFVGIPIAAGVLTFLLIATWIGVFQPEDVVFVRGLFSRLGRSLPRRRASSDGALPAGASAEAPMVSVVVCTRDRSAVLANALRSLLDQRFAAFEVVLVDQSADDSTQKLVTDLQARFPNLVYTRLASRGLSRARNAGVAASHGELVAFTDDDCVAPNSWLSNMASAFGEHPEADLVYGQVVVPPELHEREGLDGVTPMLVFTKRRLLKPPRGFRVFGMGANCAFRRTAFDRVGGFDEALGAGGLLRGGEDFDFSFRVFRTGGAILLEPALIIEHHGFRPGVEWPETVRGYGIGVGSFYFKHVRMGDLLATWMLAKMLARETAGVLRRIALRRPRGAQWTYVVHVLMGVRMSLALAIRRPQRLYVLPAETG